MRAGLPVVASNVGAVPEAVRDEGTGMLVGRGDGATLQDRLELLLDDAELRRRQGEAGRRRYEEHFTFDRLVRETTAVYDEVLECGRGVGEAVEGCAA
jgi:glycosyltransferase involved in cell wall biosynthesis